MSQLNKTYRRKSSPFKIVAINPTGPYSGQRKSHGGELSWRLKPVLKIDPLRSLWWKGPLRNFQFYYMRKRSYSLDQIPVPRNEFDEGREEHPSKRFFQVHRNNCITFIKMHWKNLEITLTMKFVAILNFITILIVRYSKQMKFGRFSQI